MLVVRDSGPLFRNRCLSILEGRMPFKDNKGGINTEWNTERAPTMWKHLTLICFTCVLENKPPSVH